MPVEDAGRVLLERGVLGTCLVISLAFNFVQWRYAQKLVEQLREVTVNSIVALKELTHTIERK